MATQSILLATSDAQMLIEIIRALGPEWQATSVASDADALYQLERREFDALLVDFNLGSPDASELLNQALEKRPQTTRFLLAYEADLALVAAKVLGGHEILPKPLEPASLKSRIENGLNGANANSTSAAPVTVSTAPAAPPFYSEVLEALDTPGVTSEQVGEIIARDESLSAELLRLTRSAYLGLPRELENTVEAVELLGLQTVKALVMARRFLAEHRQLNPGYLSLERIWQHSINVAKIARDLVLFETRDRALASEALAAGLLHDLGKVVLATNFDDLYGRVHSLARKQPVPLWDIEKEMFGANHGEIGACLVGMWNMPSPIVDAAALHHEPPLGEQDHLTPLAAVHIANVLEHQLRPSDEVRVAPIINTPFLNELGVLQRLPVWRAKFANQPAQIEQAGTAQWTEAAVPMHETAFTSRRRNQAAPRTPTPEHSSEDSGGMVPAFPFWRRRWAYAGFAAGILFLAVFWVRTQLMVDDSTPVYARTPVGAQAPAPVSATPSVATVPSAAAPQRKPAVAVSEPTTPPSAPSNPEPAISQPTTQPAPAISSQATVANVSTAILPPKQSAPPEFRVSGIIFTVTRPAAIVNGRTVHVGDRVNGATVVRISETDVTLLVNGVRKLYELP